MEALEQLTHRVTVRGGIILVASLVVVVLIAQAAHHAGQVSPQT